MSSTIRRSASSNAWAGDAVSRSTGSPSVRICITVTMFPPNRRESPLTCAARPRPRVTIPAAASRRISAPKAGTRAASTATKHIVAPPTPDESNVPGSSAASSRSSSAPPVTRNTGDPTGKPASARRGISERRNRSGRPETRAWTAGSFGASVCTMTRPSGRAHAAASNHVTSTRSRASTPGRRSEASACRIATRSRPGEPTSFSASTPPTSTSRSSGAWGGSSRPINDTGTVATPRPTPRPVRHRDGRCRSRSPRRTRTARAPRTPRSGCCRARAGACRGTTRTRPVPRRTCRPWRPRSHGAARRRTRAWPIGAPGSGGATGPRDRA